MTPKKERESGASVPPRSHRQRPSKAGRVPEASVRKERLQKPEAKEVKVEQDTEVKVRSTVVDIDSVREDEVKEENLGLLEAAEQEDGKLKILYIVYTVGEQLNSCFIGLFFPVHRSQDKTFCNHMT